MLIRSEQEKDFDQIYDLVKNSFASAPVKDGTEQEIVNKLRKSNKYIPELALVIERERKIIGYVMLTKFFIQGKTQKFESLLLAPVAISTDFQNQKLGTELIEKSFERAKEMGHTNVIVVGDPNYYHRFGFRASIEFGIDNMEGLPTQYVMAYELIPNGLKDKMGRVSLKL
ncbi:GNAT family N-acetyltransferase [Zophobihabitans entericus]|nr:N-acetyltransferase [Zophobihabitans entericus]